MSVLVQPEPIDSAKLYDDLLQSAGRKAGAVVTFTGLVRDINEGGHVENLFIEHYPGMTEKTLAGIVDQARTRWKLDDVVIVHRIGVMKPADRIVFVGVSSAHRGDSFEACEFMMDFLKTSAPFWKKETSHVEGKCLQSQWLDERQSDRSRAARWEESAENRKSAD
ncbi:MAG: molybdenum cofactor biosynthesis protein MoaE [Pseudomonadales bacterium]|nr:molybdenum cofactor biosynthesis protein MoaE [Pseudomonadales bacterium]